MLATELLVARGHRVLAGIRGGEPRLKTLFSPELIQTGRLHAVDLHMDRSEGFSAAHLQIQRDFGGKLDVLINNAGHALMGPLETQSPAQLRNQMEVNFFGPALLTRELLPCLRAAKGRIINVSSIAGMVSFPFYGSYNASKHALEGLTEALAYELKPFGIQVGLIEPGGFKTRFVEASQYGESGQDPASPYFKRIEAFSRAIRKKNERLAGNPAQVARLIVRLAECSRVPIRNIIGIDARFMAWMRRLLPERWRVALCEWVFKKGVFRES